MELFIPDLKKNFELKSDASKTGIGAVLRQDNRPVAYILRVLNKAEQNYSITEREVLAALWSMEKLEYYLAGICFDLVTDHKAIEELKKKKEFGTPRINRYFERLERFQFEAKYRSGVELVQADALSRSTRIEEGMDLEQKVLDAHEENSHRINIGESLREKGILISQRRIKKILEKCRICARKDKTRRKVKKLVITSSPGERVRIDLMEIEQGKHMVLAIDYFTRKIFGRTIPNKQADNIIKFLEELKKEIDIKMLISDNGREFDNNNVENWCKVNQIDHRLVVPYYHDGNGRIERANRTVRTALKKGKGPYKARLEKVIKTYNDIRHRGIGLSPNEAMNPGNAEKVLAYQAKYERV